MLCAIFSVLMFEKKKKKRKPPIPRFQLILVIFVDHSNGILVLRT